MTHRSVNEVFDFSWNWHLFTLLFEHGNIERNVIRDKSQIKLKIWTFKLISITLFVYLISSFFIIAFDDSVKIFKPFFFIGSEFSTVQSRRVLFFKEFFPGLSPFFAFFILLILELINLFLIVPNSLRSKDFFLFHSFFTKIRLINFDWFDESCWRFERVEEDHKILGGNVHPIIITKSKSFGSFNGWIFYNILLIIRPYFRNLFFLIFQHFLNRHISKWRRLLIILFHPLSKIIDFSFRLLSFLIILSLFIHFASILQIDIFIIVLLLFVVLLINLLVFFGVKLF